MMMMCRFLDALLVVRCCCKQVISSVCHHQQVCLSANIITFCVFVRPSVRPPIPPRSIMRRFLYSTTSSTSLTARGCVCLSVCLSVTVVRPSLDRCHSSGIAPFHNFLAVHDAGHHQSTMTPGQRRGRFVQYCTTQLY